MSTCTYESLMNAKYYYVVKCIVLYLTSTMLARTPLKDNESISHASHQN